MRTMYAILDSRRRITGWDHDPSTANVAAIKLGGVTAAFDPRAVERGHVAIGDVLHPSGSPYPDVPGLSADEILQVLGLVKGHGSPVPEARVRGWVAEENEQPGHVLRNGPIHALLTYLAPRVIVALGMQRAREAA